MRRIEENAHLSSWNGHTLEVAVLCVGLMGCSMTASSMIGGFSVMCLSAALAASAQVPLRDYLRKHLVASGFALVSILPLSVNVHFHPALSLHLDPAGTRTAMLALARSMGTLSVTLLFVFTTPFSRILSLLRRMRVPDVLLDLLTSVHREIFVLDEGFSRLHKCLSNRNGWRDSRTSRRSLSLGTVALFVKAIERSERLERGMASRGVADGRIRRWDAPIAIQASSLVLAVVVPVAMFLWIRWKEGA